jgi:hypothetical protein
MRISTERTGHPEVGLGERIVRLPGAALLVASYLLSHPKSPVRRIRTGTRYRTE